MILYDALPHWYIKKTEEADTEPIIISLEALFHFALNIEDAVLNPGKDSEGNARSSKEVKTETTVPQNQGCGKGKGDQKRSGGNSSILKGQDRLYCHFRGKSGHTVPACCIKDIVMAYDKKDTKDRDVQWNIEKTEKTQPLLQKLQFILRNKKVLKIKMKSTLTRRHL
jgi:hypothetical protein